jgi:hypothetical protein
MQLTPLSVPTEWHRPGLFVSQARMDSTLFGVTPHDFGGRFKHRKESVSIKRVPSGYDQPIVTVQIWASGAAIATLITRTAAVAASPQT